MKRGDRVQFMAGGYAYEFLRYGVDANLNEVMVVAFEQPGLKREVFVPISWLWGSPVEVQR